MKKLITLSLMMLLCSYASFKVYAQNEWEVPEDYEFKKASDYKEYEDDILECVSWLEKTPLNKKIEKRKAANRFLVTWIEGAPNVTVELHSYVADISKVNDQFMILFMGGWTRHTLNNPGSKGDKLKGHMAGLNTVLDYYKAGNGSKKDKKIDKLLVKREKGELEKWVKKEANIKD